MFICKRIGVDQGLPDASFLMRSAAALTLASDRIRVAALPRVDTFSCKSIIIGQESAISVTDSKRIRAAASRIRSRSGRIASGTFSIQVKGRN